MSLALNPGEMREVAMIVDVPPGTNPGATMALQTVTRDDAGDVVGGATLLVVAA